MYYEDSEHCHRVRAAGFDIRYVPEARIVHLQGGSPAVPEPGQPRRHRPSSFYRSRARYFRLLYGPPGPLLANLGWSLGRLVSLARELGGRERHIAAGRWRDIWTRPA